MQNFTTFNDAVAIKLQHSEEVGCVDWGIVRRIYGTGPAEPSTVRWNEVKVAVLCARQYMPWNLLLIIVLNHFWYLKHQTLTRLKHNWKFVFEKSKKKQFNKTISSLMFQICFWANPSRDLVFELSKTLIKSRFQVMYWCAHKTATLTSIQHTVPGGQGGICRIRRQPCSIKWPIYHWL